eukprot:TRINITY_DN2844_c1_g1_i1.p1 TRINITY_DN2844_c1_g1~~TRINITY_DN2844_c1_g1_i1.p1  ORF type:complete len:152 (+),score=20.49 TRINITY_DN2844_c1_g1_i1:217-672(+)
MVLRFILPSKRIMWNVLRCLLMGVGIVFHIRNKNNESVDDLIHKLEEKGDQSEMIEVITARQAEFGDIEGVVSNKIMLKAERMLKDDNIEELSSVLREHPCIVEQQGEGWMSVTLLQSACANGSVESVECILKFATDRGLDLVIESQDLSR